MTKTTSLETAEDIQEKFSISYQTDLLFESESILEKIKKSSKKRLQTRQYHLMNQWMLSLYQSDIQRDKIAPCSVKRINPIVGYGLFAKEKIRSLTYIGQYVGMVRKRKWFKDRYNDYIFGYVIGPKDTPWIIDAEKIGNHTRFMNHSDEPNVTSRWVITEDGVGRIIFFSNRQIKKGEQLTYDYGPYYWKKRSQPLQL